MGEIRVRAEQTTVDWEQGAEFDVERTPLVDQLIADGRLVALSDDPVPAAHTDTSDLGLDPDLPLIPFSDDSAAVAPNPEPEAESPRPRRRKAPDKDDDA